MDDRPSTQKYIPPRGRPGASEERSSPRPDYSGRDSPNSQYRGGGGGRGGYTRDRDRDRDSGSGRWDRNDRYDRDGRGDRGGRGGQYDSWNRDRDRERAGSPLSNRPNSNNSFVPVDDGDGENKGGGGGSVARKDLQRVMGTDHGGIPRTSSLGSLPAQGSSWSTERDREPDRPLPRASSLSSISGHHGGGMQRVNSFDSGKDGSDQERGSMSRSNSRNRLAPPPVVWPHWEPADSVKNLTQQEVDDIRELKNISVQGEEPISNPVSFFQELNADERILKDIAAHNYIRPTPIQSQALPIALSGRDILGFAETGSGKTAAFCIPMIAHILAQAPVQRGDGPIALVLAPTRELAQQIDKEAKMFSISSKLRGSIVVGGAENMSQQRSELRGGVEFVVATPGRFIQHLGQGNTSLNRCSYLVLDEADRMLDMGFEDQIREIIGRITDRRQTLLFSATMPEEIEGLASEYLRNAVRISIGSINKPTQNVQQHIEYVAEEKKFDRLLEIILSDEEEAMQFKRDQPQILVFVETKIKCEDICDLLRTKGIQADRMHADRTQPQREAALQSYRDGLINVLMATDLASRGLDVTGITHVINYDLPKKMEDYVHRIGRTGRAGTTGKATSFYDDRDMDIVVYIRRAINDANRPAEGAESTLMFAAGKAARRREKMDRELERQKRKEIEENLAAFAVDDKYKHMLITPVSSSGTPPVSDAWDD